MHVGVATDMPSATETGVPAYQGSSSNPQLDLSTNTPTHVLGNNCSLKEHLYYLSYLNWTEQGSLHKTETLKSGPCSV